MKTTLPPETIVDNQQSTGSNQRTVIDGRLSTDCDHWHIVTITLKRDPTAGRDLQPPGAFGHDPNRC